MILAIKKSKFIKNVAIFGLSFCFCAGIPVFMFVFEADRNDPKKWIVLVLALLLATFFGFFLFHLLRVRNRWHRIMAIENDVFYDYSGAFKHPKIIPLAEIISVVYYNSGKTYTLKIKRRSASRRGNSFADQLNGSDIYVTDILVDRSEFESLFTYMQSEIERLKTENKS